MLPKIAGRSENFAQLLRSINYGKPGDCKIIDSVVFKWYQKLNEPIIWKIRFTDFSTTNQIEFSKTRTLVQVNSVKSVVLFKNLFHFEKIGTNIKYDYSMDTYYQKGMGLINYKLYLPDGSIKDYQLKGYKDLIK
jgi:hypothetical protein